MGSFYYEAIKKSGETVSGKIEADQESNVVERLRSMDLMVMEIKELRESGLKATFKPGGKVSPGDLSLFSRQLAAMISSGIPLTRALFTLSKQVTNPTLSKALSETARNVEGGISLSEALKQYPNIFDSLYINMVSAGEAGGSLEVTLNRLSNQLQKTKELRDNIKSASFYPLVVLGFAVLILFGMLFFLVPIFMGFFPEDAVLPLPTRMIIGLSNLVTRYWYILLPILLLLVFALRSYAKSPGGKKRLDRIFFRLPIFGPLIQKAAIASFARTFSTLLATGIPVVQALDASGKGSGNTMIIEAAEMAGEKIQEGSSVAEPLEESGVFPPMVTHMIAVGEETGNIPDMMDKVASFFEEEVATITKGLTSLIEPLMLIVIGVLVGGMLIALYLPIFTVITQI
jgi:type IV pilus assembly protein PilC